MKVLTSTASIFSILCSLAFGGLEIPRKAFPLSQLDKAKEEAAKRGKPIIFMETHPGYG